MAASTDIPTLLEGIRKFSEDQYNLLKAQSDHGKERDRQQNSVQTLNTINSVIGSVLPQGLAQPVQHIARSGMNAMTLLGKAGRAAGSAGSAIGNITSAASAAAAFGPVAAAAALAAGAFVAVTAAVVSIPFAIYGWTQSLLESQRQIARFSPELAGIFLTFDAAQMARDRAMGRETAGSTGDLAQSMSAIEDALLPIRIAITNIENRIGGALLDRMTELVEGVADLLGLAGELQDDMSGPNAFKAQADLLAKEHGIERQRAARAGHPPFAGRP